MAKTEPILDKTQPAQQSALNIFPVLVRQAKARQTITYGYLAEEVGIPHAQNVGVPLDWVNHALLEIEKYWEGEKIPPIQSIVVRKDTGMPGDRTRIFRESHNKSEEGKRALHKDTLANIFAYNKWDAVLNELGLQPAPIGKKFADMAKNPPSPPATTGGRGGGESEEHKALKLFIGDNPSSVDINPNGLSVITERRLPSGDSLDVSFEDETQWIGVEVKSLSKSNDDDIMRGLYQCVKYRAVMQASLTVQSVNKNVRVILALDGELPHDLKPVRNTLGIEVVEGITVK